MIIEKTDSLGVSRVRESSSPGKNSLTDIIKGPTADLIDFCNEESGKSRNPEEQRLWDLAMTHYEEAAMWAMKAATTPKEKNLVK